MDIYNVDIKNINSEQTQKRAKMETKVKFDKLPTQMQKYIQESEKNKKQAESERIGKYNAAMQKLQQKRTSRLASEKLEADRVKNLRGDELTEYLRGSFSNQFGANTDKILGNLIDKAKGYITDNSKEYGWEEFNKAIDQHNEEVKKYEEEAYKLIPSRTQSQIQADIDAVKTKSNRPLLVKAGEAIASGWNYITGNQDKTEQMQNRNQQNEDLLESYEKELEKRKYWDSLDGTTEEKLNAMAEYDAYERFIAEAEKQGYTADELINYLGTRAGDSLLNWLDNVKTSAEKYASFGSGFVKSFTGAKNPTLKPYSPTQDEKSDKLLDKLWESAKYGMKQSDAVLEEAAKENKAGKRALDTYNQYINVAVDPVAQGVGDVVGATAYMLPTIALTSFIPGAADDVTLGAQAANTLIKQVPSAALMRELGYTDAYIEARNDGASISQAKDYASREGINQGLGDMLIGGLGGIGDGILSTSLNKITKGAFSKTLSKAAGKLVTSPAGRTALKYFGSSLGEGVEESIQNVVSTYNKKFTYDKNAKVNWGDVLYEGIIGSAMGGFFSLSEISSNYKAYKADADVVNTFAKAAEKIATTDDAEAMRDLGEFIVAQMDETINDKSVDDETKERAEFIKAGISSIAEVVSEKSADIISTNESISDAVESIATSSTAEVVENTARLVDTVADNIEPSTDAVNATIDIVREKIADANADIADAQTDAEKKSAMVEKAVLEEIDSTLRNKRAEVIEARDNLAENNLTVPESDATIEADTTNSEYDYVFDHVIQQHTKTGEDLHVIKIPARVEKAEYNKIKTQIQKIGGHYSTYQKGFIIPAESVGKIADNLAEINIGIKDLTGASDTNTTVRSAAALSFPEGITTADKTKFTRLFKKWMENERINITDMTSEQAALFASFASKLYAAGYNGVRQIGNYAGLTDAELTSFPPFLYDEFYNLGKNAAANKPAISSQNGAETKEANPKQEPDNTNKEAQTSAEPAGVDDNVVTLSKKTISYFKKSNKNYIGEINGQTYITDGVLCIAIKTKADKKTAVEELNALTTKCPDNVTSAFGSATTLMTEAPTEGKSGDKDVLAFNTKDGKFFFQKKLFSYIDGGLLYYGKFGKGAIIKSVNTNGDVIGYLLGMNMVSGVISDEKPAVLKSFSKKMQDAIRVKSGESVVDDIEKGENIPEAKIADYVAERLAEGETINSKDLQAVANEAFGGTQSEGAYDAHAMTDAMELGVNKHLLSMIGKNEDTFNSDSAADAVEAIHKIDTDILAKIPTQTKRSDEQISLQQFSTPPNIAYVAAWAANIDATDVALEPSAGIGGLATFAKAFGAETVVNELSPRRLEVIKNMPFDSFYNENAEYIDNILPDNVKPSVVIMNPPFSSNAGRTKNSTKNAIPHIEQALLRLEDGGRLVAILGRGMANDTPTFKNWWNKLRETYNIRANIGINGENYRKYGTTFDVQLVVIDKTGPQTGETITGYYDNLDNIPALLEGVRNDRTRTLEADGEVEQNASITRGSETGIKTVSRGTRTDSDSSSRGVSGRNDSARTNGNMELSDGDSTRGARKSDIVDRDAEVQPEGNISVSDDGRKRGRMDGRNVTNVSTEQGSRGMDTGDSRTGTAEQSGGVVQSESVAETPKKRSAKKASENDDGVYAEYKTTPLTVKGAKKHPAKLVESSAMSAVSAPALTYKPKLDQSLIKDGALSDAQLENICYAGQAHSTKLKNGQRKGYFIGDGTGVGKGRQLAGIIMDNWNQGRHKAIWISENKNLSTDARRDWADLGGDPNQIIDWEKAQKKGIPNEGILFIPYSSLAGGKTKNRATTTLETIEAWFGKNFDGVIVFDEAHNMGNLIPMKGARGTKKPSQKAIAGDKLQQELPNARITYASATGATNIENLSYASRLGLWGEGTSFRDANDFISKIGRAGIAAMELVARDMKSMGVYLARSISYDGVVYDNIQHKLSSVQRKMYDGMSEGWQIVLQNFDKAMQATGSENAKDVKQRRGQVYGNMQQFYNQVLTSMAMPTVIKDIEKQLESGKSCVIQLVNTNEAAQDRAVSDAKSEGKTDLDDLDITPRQLLVGYVENAFPINQYEEYIDDNGNVASRMVLDSNGQPVINRQAVRMKENLIAQLNVISIPEGPLDMLLNHFGADKVAEITGRSGRVLTITDENGNEHKQYVSRDSGKANIAETKDFQDGKKRILVFSGAGATGRSFHADKRAQNQQQRIHYVLQPGWKAETAVQGFGRTHRSNQVNTPVFRLVSTDVMGHKRFVTSIARRLDQLGALTKGQRQTGSGVFGEKDNLESPLSRQALREFYRRLGTGRIEGLDAKSVLGKMGLDKAFYDEYDRFNLNEVIASDITKFLNRILALPVDEQNDVFAAFEDIRDSMYQQALESGALDTGLENVKADKIEIAQDDVIYTDPATGAETRYVKAKLYVKPKLISTVDDAQAYRNGFQGIYRLENGSVRAVYRIADRTDQWGGVVKNFALISPNTGVQSRYIEPTLKAKAEAIPKAEWESAWAEELAKVPEYNEGERHMITGAILPVWNRLPESDNVKAQRIISDDGSQYLGRIIKPEMLDSTLRSFDVKAQKTEHTGKTIYNEIFTKNNTVTMRGVYGGTITISKRRVSNENRIEVSGSGALYLSDKFPGIFSETIQYQRRYFIPSGDKGIEILDAMVKELGVRSIESEDSGAYYSLGTSAGKWGKGDTKAQVMSINELTRQATRIFGVEINTGKIGNKNASGVFKTHAGTIRTRVYGDLPTIAHEIGHFFDKKYNLQSSPFIETLIKSFGTDLENAGYSDAQIPAEAIAEYFTAYMNDRHDAEQKYKPFTQWLYENISTADQKRLYDYSGMTNAYFAADLERRADAQIHTRAHDGKFTAQAQMQLDTFLKNPKAYSGQLARKFARWFIDDIIDLKGFGKAYDLAYLEKQADSVVIGRLKSAMTDKDGNIIGDSLATILTKGSINELNRLAFDKYLVACVALDRINAAENAKSGESIGSLVYGDEALQNKDSIVERIATYERENPTFHDTAEQIYGYNRNLMQLAVQSGLMSQELVDSLNERYPHYVPLYRVMNDKDGKGNKAKRGYADQKSPIARFKGSGRDVYSPLENIMINTEKFTKACMRNDVMTEFADYIDFNEDMGWAAEKVTEKKFLDRVSTNDVAEKILSFSSDKLNSMSESEIEDLLSEMIDFVGDYTTQWKAAMYQGKNVVSVMRNGKREYYEIHDVDILKCLNNLNSSQMNIVIKALGGATATFKVLTTGSNPVFGVTNVQRDLISGYVSSTTTNNPFIYAKDYVVGLWEALRQSEGYKQYVREGGGYSDAISRDTSRLRKTNAELVKTTNNLKRFTQFIGNVLPRLVESGESASRYAEYKRAKTQGIEALEAVRKSQEVTVNFARGGSVVKDIDKVIPYFRASINSMYHLVEVLTTGDKKTKATRWAKFVGVNTIPAVIALAWRAVSAAVFGEDEDEVEEAYQTLSAYNKNAYWCFYVGNGEFFRVAKPKDMTVLSTVWERLVEYGFMGEEDALYGLGGYIVDSLCPPAEITFIGTAIDLAKNETYTGAPIVPQTYEKLAPEQQYKEDTSKLSVFFGVSPMKLDYILEDNTGFVGQLITNLLRVDGEINLGFTNKFIVDSVYSTDVASIFYDTKEKYDTNAASYKHTLGKDDRYSISDVYGSYKYDKIASTYSDLNKWMKAEKNADTSREMKSKMNAFVDAVNRTEMSDLDRAVLNIAEVSGVDINDIAPYVVVPDKVTYNKNKYKEQFDLTFDEILTYYAESQAILNAWYLEILESGYSEEMMAEAMTEIKKEVGSQMRDRWEEIKFNQKYN